MNCIKCGREYHENSVFCAKCLDVMKKYKVPSDAKLQLPQRKPTPAKKAAPRKKILPTEELIVQQRKTIKLLCVTLVCTVLLLALSITFLCKFMQEEEIHVTIGQNYMTKDPTVDN
ncbi:MAG: hypothetical protein IKU17_00980 [Clostridia bacterium]|nr:hypothetical protein [Clostridia bacterium]